MNDFKDMPAIDRRRFLAGFLATAASAGVLGKLGIGDDWVTMRYGFATRDDQMQAAIYWNDLFVGNVAMEDKGGGNYVAVIPPDMLPPKNGLVRAVS